MFIALNSHLARVQHQHGDFAVVYNPKCLTCTSPHRALIERRWMEGDPISVIHRELSEGVVSRKSISRHVQRGHVPADLEVIHKAAQARAEDRWEEFGRQLTELGIAKVDGEQRFLALAEAHLRGGTVEISARDALGAIRWQSSLERHNSAGFEEARRWKSLCDSHESAVHALVLTMFDELGEPRVFELLRQAERRGSGSVLGLSKFMFEWRFGFVNGRQYDFTLWDEQTARWRPTQGAVDDPDPVVASESASKENDADMTDASLARVHGRAA